MSQIFTQKSEETIKIIQVPLTNTGQTVQISHLVLYVRITSFHIFLLELLPSLVQ